MESASFQVSSLGGKWVPMSPAAAAPRMASVTAWAVATPIALFHWGVAWPLAAPFSVVLLPLVTAVVVADTNFVKPERYGANQGTAVYNVTVTELAAPLEISAPGAVGKRAVTAE